MSKQCRHRWLKRCTKVAKIGDFCPYHTKRMQKLVATIARICTCDRASVRCPIHDEAFTETDL